MDKGKKAARPAAVVKKRGKYASKPTKAAQLDIIKDCVAAGMSAAQIQKNHTKGAIPLRTIQRYAKSLKNGGEICAGRAPGGGRKVKSAGLVGQLKEKFNPDGKTISRNVRNLARSLKVTRDEVRYACKVKLSLKNVAKVKGARMSAKNIQSRRAFAEYVVGRLAAKKNPLKVGSIWFSDEKLFTAVPRHQGTRNDRVLIPSDMKKADVDSSVIVRGVPSHGLQVMVGWCISTQGRINPYVLPPKTFINEDVYVDQMLEGTYFPQIKHANGGAPFVFSQDRASCHYSKKSIAWLNKNAKGWLQEWPAKGADMNPLDYGIWSQLQEKVWSDNCTSLLDLKASIHKHISELSDATIRTAIESFEKRVKMCLAEQGGHFEHKLSKKSK